MVVKNKIHFEVSERKVLLRSIDVVCVLLALYVIGYFFNFDYLKSSLTNKSSLLILAIYINSIGTVFEMYNLQVARNQFQILRSTILTASLCVLLYLFTPIFSAELPSSRFQILIFYATFLVALLLWRSFYAAFLTSTRFVQNVLLISDTNEINILVQDLESSDPHYKITAFLNSNLNDLSDYKNANIKKISINNFVEFVKNNRLFEIVIASQKNTEINTDLYLKLLHLSEAGNTIREYTQVFEDKTQRIPLQYINKDFYKFFPFNRSNNNQLYLLIVRIMETLISIFGLIIGAFLTPIIIIINAIANKGSLFYSQERIGKNGKPFKIHKFRTMVKNAESDGAVFSIHNDSRVTPFGRIMRKTRIDEFPQFLNILKGEMGVIGPRPERPFFVKEISEIMPLYETRHVIKPGITGWAQVNYSYGESMEDSLIKLEYDLYYIKHRSIFLDFSITLKTLSTILFYRGQ